jgi:nucleoid-associated protein YgaU
MRCRATGVLLLSGAVELMLLRLAAVTTHDAAAGLTLDQQVTSALATGAVGAALLAWTGWCAALLRALHWGGRQGPAARPRTVAGTVPSRWLRAAAVVLGVGALGVAGTTPAVADGTSNGTSGTCGARLDGRPATVSRWQLDGLRLPSLPSSLPAQPPARSAHVVTAGESLWSIAAAQLGPGTSSATVDRLWPRWYAANRAVIGPDPNLIVPGQPLRPPPQPPLPVRTDR